MASNAEGTWGIPGPLFVILYLGAIVALPAVAREVAAELLEEQR